MEFALENPREPIKSTQSASTPTEFLFIYFNNNNQLNFSSFIISVSGFKKLMGLLNPPAIYGFPVSSPLSKPQGFNHGGIWSEKQKSVWSERDISGKHNCFVASGAAGKGTARFDVPVPFPRDYTQLLQQAKEATQLALKDDKQLMEIEFPTAGLESVPGDGEGGIEMTGSMELLREYCDLVVSPDKAVKTRVFFPEANEVALARNSAFGGCSLKLDYLTKPSLFEDFGFGTKVKMADRVKPEDELFLVGYPYFNVNEMLVVEELYKEAVVNTSRKMIVFNGELDRIRSGYYPRFFYPKLGALLETFLPKMETIYYIHNFKGRNGGALFRCYPWPWNVLRKVGNAKFVCVHQQETMPSLKEVALEILPSA